MPEMHFHVRWPDGTEEACYSPSSIIRDFIAPGETYPLADFMTLVRTALGAASDRVRAKYGFPCSAAAAQLSRLEQRGQSYAALPSARVTCLSITQGV